MLQSIIDYLTIKLQALKIADVYGLGELVVDKDSQKPCLYNGSGQYCPLSDFDNHSGLIYFRLVSPVSNTIAESQIGGDEVFQRTYNLRVVAYVNKAIYNTDNNYIDDKIAHNIQIAIDNEDDGLLSTSLGAQTATIQTITYDTNRSNVSDGESLDFEIPFEYVFLALDFNVVIIGSQDCFSTYGCNDTPIDYLELLRAEVCETECQQATAIAKNSDGDTLSTTFIDSGASADITITDSTILRSDATTIATVPAQDPYTVADTPVRLEYVNGTLISNTNVKAASSATIQAPNPATLQETIDANTSANIGGAINTAIDTTKPDGVFTSIIPNVDNDTINSGLSLAQRNYLSNLNVLKSGITTSYITGDDGDLEEGRGTDWFTLANGQPRFTVYGSYPTLFKDNLTGISWRNVFVGAKNDADYYSEAASLTDGGLAAGSWKVPNMVQVESLLLRNSDPLNYAPINYSAISSGSIRFVTSTPATIDPVNNNQTYLITSTGVPAAPSNLVRVGTGGGLSIKRMLYCTLETII